MLVSIIIPTYNEADDICETLEALIALEYKDKEIIVVDASQDETPQIVRSYSTKQVNLITQSRGKGRAAARNEGILAARGEIVIILNADVRLPRDFIQRILRHYEAGADYVLVESRVTNLESSIARYLQAMHEWQYPPRPEIEANMNWTEGFSCKREAALAVGGIPEGDLVPLLAGEDGWFGENLAAARFRKVFDRSILVTHVMPPDIKTFWRQRAGRSQGMVQIWAMQHHWSLRKIVEVTIKSCTLGIAGLLIPISALTRCWRLSKFSSRGMKDFFVFSLIDWIASTANVWGLIAGVLELQHAGAK
jgi:glycosyltransferase involved in cell wall biosynthesis